VTAYYEKIEIVGVSSKSYEDAIARAVSEVRNSYKELRWFEIVEFRGGINDDGSIQYQVVIKVAAKKG
jgi:dodecin